MLHIPRRSLFELARAFGGEVGGGAADAAVRVERIARTADAGAGDLGVLIHRRYVEEARAALARGAALLVDASLASVASQASLADVGTTSNISTSNTSPPDTSPSDTSPPDTSASNCPIWIHPRATRALAALLDTAEAPATAPVIESELGAGVHVLPRVRIGKRVRIDPGCVIGAPGFGHVAPSDGDALRSIPQLGGVIIEDDVEIGALCTIAAGTLAPTIIRRGARLDAQVHVGHNCEVGEGTLIAAQTGLAGSVRIGRGVLIGGQVGIADHIVIGDGARIAAKSGVIGDVAPGETVGGYPAVARMKWLRGLAKMYRDARRGE